MAAELIQAVGVVIAEVTGKELALNQKSNPQFALEVELT